MFRICTHHLFSFVLLCVLACSTACSTFPRGPMICGLPGTTNPHGCVEVFERSTSSTGSRESDEDVYALRHRKDGNSRSASPRQGGRIPRCVWSSNIVSRSSKSGAQDSYRNSRRPCVYGALGPVDEEHEFGDEEKSEESRDRNEVATR